MIDKVDIWEQEFDWLKLLPLIYKLNHQLKQYLFYETWGLDIAGIV